MAEPKNLLREESSPYLIQHADNPVHWRPWGAVALEEARSLDRPILLSIGYAACHWCHVMAHESFENDEIAALMNRLFVNIKVDREERPDIDGIYMSALHALGEQGGWPLTMFLTPDGSPFWGGTYWPPEPRYGRPGFRQVLASVEATYRQKPESIAQNVRALGGRLAQLAQTRPGDVPGPDVFARIAQSFVQGIDPVHHGLGGAPKFPNCPIFRFLWQSDFALGTTHGRAVTRALLRALCQGGIYDHLGGGFARYSVDAEWHVPHFEKMLYDNAQILELLALAQADEAEPLFARRADETVTWLVREMTGEHDAQGNSAFAASLDADQEGEEGRFYVFSRDDIDAALGDDADAFARAYDVRADGNWEHTNVLRRVTPDGDEAAEGALAASREKLLAMRETRVPPARDDKILADWNGLMIAALARASVVFDRTRWLALARRAFAFVDGAMRDTSGRLAHAMRAGRISAGGLLDDHAMVSRAALALFEVTGERAFLDRALAIVHDAQHLFGADDGSFYTTAFDATDVPGPRPRRASDDATPSASGVIAEVLARLFQLTGDVKWRDAAERAISAHSGSLQMLAASPSLLAAADLLARGPVAIVAGVVEDFRTQALVRTALTTADPALSVLRTIDGADWPTTSPAYGRTSRENTPAGYICRNMVCGLPVSDADAYRAAIDH